jgi:transposase
MKVYAGIDLHSTNSYIAMVDGEGHRLKGCRTRNDLKQIVEVLSEHGDVLEGIVVESTYNWYWLVDGLMDQGWKVHLANPAAMQKYAGKKHVDDRHDAFWLAEMLRLKILPEGYIYPKQARPVRDLLRTRGTLVSTRTSLMTTLSNIVIRNTGRKPKSGDLKVLRENRMSPLLSDNRHLQASIEGIKATIDVLTRRITRIEKMIESSVKLDPAYENLRSIPGVGKVLGLTIVLETGPISRFPSVGNYVSYCRKVASCHMSNDKVKGRGNVKNGNRHLANAFGQAADHARRYDDRVRAFYNRKKRKTNAAVAHGSVARKLARATYHMMNTGERFVSERAFG